MRIVVGTDLVDVRRMERAYHRHGLRLAQKLLTVRERKFLPAPLGEGALYIAKIFCAKEAYFKAFGDFLTSPPMFWQGISILRKPSGRPYICHDPAQPPAWSMDISLSDEYPYVQATVIGLPL